MVIKNIVKIAAEYLDLKDVLKYLNNEVEATDTINDTINNLVLATNMVNNNIASSYIELIGNSQIMSNENFINYSDISVMSIIEIKSVSGTNGRKIDFKIRPEGIKVDYNGLCEIEYSYFPERVSLDDEINYYLKLNEMTFAMGVAGEYLYIKGSIDDAYMWDKRFKSSMFNLLRPKRNIVIPARRW